MDFAQAKEYVTDLGRFGSVLGLCNIKELLKRLDNPQDRINVIHVAGTNGKGSVIAYLSTILTEASYKVGKYTSPAVFQYLEKYQINNKNMSEKDFGIIAERVKTAVDSMISEGLNQPTQFEVETAVAFEYFVYSGCDIVIIETGMGGDTDATNVCNKVLASIVMSISLDHMQYLGDTLEEIARHKAGIIKKDCPVVLYRQSEEVMQVIKGYADKLNAPVIVAGTDNYCKEPFDYKTVDGFIYENVVPGLKGHWQINNAMVAIETVEVLKKQGFCISIENVIEGLKNTVWPGRFEKISDEPHIIIDGAHNPGAAKQLRQTILRDYGKTKLIYIMGVLADKDFSEVISLTADLAVKIITITPENQRALGGEKLAEAVSKINKNVVAASDIESAVDMAKREYNRIDGEKMILAFGSLSYLGKLRQLCMQMKE